MTTTCKTFVLLLLLALPLTIPAQPAPTKLPPKARIDSVRQRLRTAAADTNQVNQLLQLGQYYVVKFAGPASRADTVLVLVRRAYVLSQTLHYQKGQGRAFLVGARAWLQKEQVPQAMNYARQALQLFRQAGYDRGAAEACVALADCVNEELEQLPEQARYYEQALALYRKLGNVKAQADILTLLGQDYFLLEKGDTAIARLQLALRLYRSTGQRHLSNVYNLLSQSYAFLQDDKHALAYGLLAVKTAEQLRDSSMAAANAYHLVGRTYRNQGYKVQAVRYFRQALALAQRLPKDEDDTALLIGSSLVSLLAELHQPAAALRLLTKLNAQLSPTEHEQRFLLVVHFLQLHTALKQYDAAQHDYDQALELLRLPVLRDDAYRFGLLYSKVVPLLLATKRYDEARTCLAQQAAYYSQHQHNLGGTALTHLYGFRLDSALGNYPAAIRHYQQYTALHDSLTSEAKAKEISRLDVQYQSERKDQAIKLQGKNILLLNKQRLLQDQELQRVQLLRNGAAAGAVLLLLLLGISYNRYQLKQRSNQLLESKQAEINQQNQSLAKLLAEKGILLDEKEWMLKEIHHRVKNNLQVIKSLLNLQSDFLQDPIALNAMRESQNRVHAMALIHQKLYQSDNLARVNMQEYIQDIVAYLVNSFSREDAVTQKIDIAAVELDVAAATPLGLIINEAVTNSLKYAFPKQQRGIIAVSLTRTDGPHRYQLTIADNGVGMPEGFYVEQVRTLGLTMIKGLSKQIDATLTIAQDSGVQITLEFESAPKPISMAA